MGTDSVASVSIGSPSSRLFWHIFALAGTLGNCQLGVRVLMNGSAKVSASSCESGVTSAKSGGKRPAGVIQLAKVKSQRGWGVTPLSRKKVWKPSTQHPANCPWLLIENR